MDQGQKDAKKWFIRCFASLLLSIFLVFLIVWIFDPYFHFHKPFSFVSYRLYDERYTMMAFQGTLITMLLLQGHQWRRILNRARWMLCLGPSL